MPLTKKSLRTFQTRLLTWFHANRREHPWRQDRDHYRVWLAEVMLQQTRIAAVIPYYEKFLAQFPNIESLASAPEQDVLRLWAGLGYYSRARNLQKAAREIVATHAGTFPADFDQAMSLPGLRAVHSASGAQHRLRCPARSTRWKCGARSSASQRHPRESPHTATMEEA